MFILYIDVFKHKRLIVAVNKIDRVCGNSYDCDEEEELNVNDVVNKVHEFITEVCGCPVADIPKEIVIPVFGLGACNARMLARYPNSAERKNRVVRILSQFKSQPSGQGERPETAMARESVTQLVKKLETFSNIQELEQRYCNFGFNV